MVAFATLYLGVTAGFVIGLLRRPKRRNKDQPFVSVVIAARDEGAFIGACLKSLTYQTYPADRYEIIVVDDDSTDDTNAEILKFENVRCLQPSKEFESFAAKKRPMATGIAASRGPLILTTDADCTVPETWIKTVVSHFTEETDVVIGYSEIAPISKSLTHRFQSYDFFALLSAAAGAAGLGRAWAATGQNFAYRREVYDRVNGFRAIANRPSGDDVLLLQLFRKAGASVAFCKASSGHVTTWRGESIGGLINQRKRWASNAIKQPQLNPCFFAYIASVLTITLLPILAIFLGGPFVTLLILTYGFRILLEGTVLALGIRELEAKQSLWFFPVWMLLQIPYVWIVGIGGCLSSFEWKNRSHHSSNTPEISQFTKDQQDINHATM